MSSGGSGTSKPSRSPRDRWFARVLALAVLLGAGWLGLDGGSGPPRWWWRLAVWEFPVRPTPRGPERPDGLAWSPGPSERPAPWIVPPSDRRREASGPSHPSGHGRGTGGGPDKGGQASLAGPGVGEVRRRVTGGAGAGAGAPGGAVSSAAEPVRTTSGGSGGRPRPGTRIVVHARLHVLELYRDSLRLMVAPVGLGRAGSTPAGRFPVVSLAVDPAYRSPSGRIIPGGDPTNPLGRRWIGLEVPGRRGIAIHGTTDPASIGQDRSRGCIRMRDHDLKTLYRLIARDTQVEIVP